jgi:hypothetical protein
VRASALMLCTVAPGPPSSSSCCRQPAPGAREQRTGSKVLRQGGGGRTHCVASKARHTHTHTHTYTHTHTHVCDGTDRAAQPPCNPPPHIHTRTTHAPHLAAAGRLRPASDKTTAALTRQA